MNDNYQEKLKRRIKEMEEGILFAPIYDQQKYHDLMGRLWGLRVALEMYEDGQKGLNEDDDLDFE